MSDRAKELLVRALEQELGKLNKKVVMYEQRLEKVRHEIVEVQSEIDEIQRQETLPW